VCRLTGKHAYNLKRLQRKVREDPVLLRSLPSGDGRARGQESGYKHPGVRVSAGKREEAKGTVVPLPALPEDKTAPLPFPLPHPHPRREPEICEPPP